MLFHIAIDVSCIYFYYYYTLHSTQGTTALASVPREMILCHVHVRACVVYSIYSRLFFVCIDCPNYKQHSVIHLLITINSKCRQQCTRARTHKTHNARQWTDYNILVAIVWTRFVFTGIIYSLKRIVFNGITCVRYQTHHSFIELAAENNQANHLQTTQ